MKKIKFPDNSAQFLLYASLIFLLYTLFIIFSGYFEIGLLADDYLNFAGAENSSFKQKFASSIPYISNLHFRPMYYLSINFSVWINHLLGTAKDNFIIFRIENLLFFYTLIFLSSYLLFKITRKLSLTIAFILMCLFYPSNLNDICWTVGKNDLMCGLFLILSLIFTFRYIEDRSRSSYYFTGVFFLLGICTKETSLILPFITILIVYTAYGKKVFEIKNLMAMEILILLFYTLFRIYILGLQPAEVVTRFQRPGIMSSISVSMKAFISLIIPYDFLSIQNYLHNYNFVFIIYVILILIFFVGVIFILVRMNKLKFIFLLLLIFLVSISPNLIAGYFRPQLILIPFLVISFSLMLIASNLSVNLRFYAVTLILIFILWVKLSFDLISDWNLSYQKGKKDITSLVELKLDPAKRNLIIGLPSRYNQSYCLDYVSGAYNYWKYGEFIIKDRILDPVYTGALDEGSLNSGLKIYKYPDSQFDIFTRGKTQYFLRLDTDGKKYKDNDFAFFLTEKNIFKKPTNFRLGMKNNSIDVYALSEEKYIKLNE